MLTKQFVIAALFSTAATYNLFIARQEDFSPISLMNLEQTSLVEQPQHDLQELFLNGPIEKDIKGLFKPPTLAHDPDFSKSFQ